MVVSTIFYFHPYLLGEDEPNFDLRIFFQMGGEKPATRKMMNMSLKGRFVFLDLPSEIGVRFMDDVWAAALPIQKHHPFQRWPGLCLITSGCLLHLQ